MSRDLRAAQEFWNKERQMPPSPDRSWLVPLSLKPLGINNRAIREQGLRKVTTQRMILFHEA